jgi:hypothetical protein
VILICVVNIVTFNLYFESCDLLLIMNPSVFSMNMRKEKKRKEKKTRNDGGGS